MTTSSHATSRTDPLVDHGEPELRSLPPLLARTAARAVDMFTVLFVTLAVVLVGLAPAMDALSDRVDPAPWGRALAATVLYATVSSLYEVSFLVARGQTPGKDLLNLRVVDTTTGEPPGWSRAIVRTAPFAVLRLVPGAFLGTAVTVVLGASAPFDRQRRGIHDLLARTVVVRYDADEEEEDGDPPRVDRSELTKVYGARSIWGMLTERRDRD